ncbi:hypothetical protein EYF80_001220 [Liparis tanakae]|uniref:Uncharacterized protein n=1 Tax=Liparis tanakae TaxID=230148 RepID=A0A4Z2JFP9_9TELE|nr:hypothetical protein EYF80_001220 [Liparis tanakae]
MLSNAISLKGRVAARVPLLVCGERRAKGDLSRHCFTVKSDGDSSGKLTADKRLLFCKQPSDLLRLGLAPFQMGLFVLALSANRRVTDSPGEGLMALLYAAHRAGWSLRSCRAQRGVCVPSETEGKRANKTALSESQG